MDTTGSDRVWLITGASSGFGRDFVRGALDAGDRVMSTARSVADLEGPESDRLLHARLDVTDQESIDSTVAYALDRFGRIDVLVNNAGFGLLGAFEEIDEPDFRHNLEVNFFGPLAVTRAVLPSMRARRSGHIVQMSSVIGVVPGPGGTAYAGGKFALKASRRLSPRRCVISVSVSPSSNRVRSAPMRVDGRCDGEPLSTTTPP